MTDTNQPDIEDDEARKRYTHPYTGKHPIPTIQGYREHRKELEQQYADTGVAQDEPGDDSKAKRAYASAKRILKGEDDQGKDHDPYPSANRREEAAPGQHQTMSTEDPQHVDKGADSQKRSTKGPQDTSDASTDSKKANTQEKSATEHAASATNPRDKRKAMKHVKRGGGREVTDPVTHMPIVIRDQMEHDLKSVEGNIPHPGSEPRTATGLSAVSKSASQLDREQAQMQQGYDSLIKSFPPPSFEDTKRELEAVYKLAITAALTAILVMASLAVFISGAASRHNSEGSDWSPWWITGAVTTMFLAAGAFIVWGVRGWLGEKVKEIWDDETWTSARQEEDRVLDSDTELPESVQWLNRLLSSVWPLINPDLFASLVDTLEDVMQASLPKVVRMVSVNDMGQGSESIRILGLRWLPSGAASQTVDEKGNVKPQKKQDSDRTDAGEGEEDDSTNDNSREDETAAKQDEKKKTQRKQQEQEQEAIREGMEAEQGDFVSLETAFAYRSSSSGKSLREKSRNAHLYLRFWLFGGIPVPVWVELRGIVGIMRMRLQLSPDPPFFNLCTLTFLGQPKASLACVPLSKHSLNLMDVPLISSFVQSAIDAALAEYVAPKSLTLNLKDMLVGEDFKKDTISHGVVWIQIKRARDFKQGDGGVGPMQGSSDAYVTVSWGKFGKPVAATRIIEETQEPNWNEWANILVSADELNAHEKLRLQLWDSDKWTADDDLGRVELDLRDLMHNPDTKNKMSDREDRFRGEDPNEEMPGTLFWSVGYFAKSHITQKQLEQQNVDERIRSKESLKAEVSKKAKAKLREAGRTEKGEQLHPQKVQDYKELEDSMIISAPPSDEIVSGILSIQIHNITGLEQQKLNKGDKGGEDLDREDEADLGEDIPDSYATIIINHQKMYRTRTKPKNAKPFFNAGTERFIKDWRTTEVIISVRDSREREDDALLGVVYLPLWQIFKEKSQVMQYYPLAGGIGYGRARISMVFRSVDIQLPPQLRGWDYGTAEIKGPVKPKGDLPFDLMQRRIKLRSNLGKIKMYPKDGCWHARQRRGGDSTFLAVRKRYASALVIEFRKSALGPDKTPAFVVLWWSDVIDEEDETKTLKVWKGGKKELQRAQACCDYNGLEEGEQPLGEIELTLRFWAGLSGYHKSHAAKNKNADLRNVMECLDTVNDEKMNEDSETDESDDTSDSGDDTDDDSKATSKNKREKKPGETTADVETRKKLQTHTNQADDTNSEDSDLDPSDGGFSKVKAPISAVKEGLSKMADAATGKHDNNDDGSRGPRAQIQDYREHRHQLHRKHRGVMQWKGARTLNWMGGKVRQAKGRVGDIFEHSSKDAGIETEV